MKPQEFVGIILKRCLNLCSIYLPKSLKHILIRLRERFLTYRYSGFVDSFPPELLSTNLNLSPKLKFDILEINQVYNLNINSIIHIGAHRGEEANSYFKDNIAEAIFFEPNPTLFETLKQKVDQYENYRCFNLALGDSDGKVFLNLASNDGQSSSVLLPKEIRFSNSEIEYQSKVEVRIQRLDSVLPKDTKYDSMVIDVEGYELHVLRGAIETLNKVKYIFIEIHRSETYEGCAQVVDVDLFLNNLGFDRVLTRWWKSWGDAFYVSRDHLSI